MSLLTDNLALVVVGLTTGSIYAIAAMGLVLTYKTSGVFNFAHGAQAAIAAFLMYTFRATLGLPTVVAITLTLAIAGVLGGLLLERLAHALASRSTADRIVATVGLLVGINGLLIMLYGAVALPFDQFLPTGLVGLPGVNVRVDQFIQMGLALAAAVGMYLFFDRSHLGVSMQGVVDDPDLLSLQGISPVRVRRVAWVVGSLFASLSGVLLAPALGLDATLLTLLVVQAFGAAAIGGFNSLPLTYLGAIGIGVGVAVLPSYLGDNADLAGQAVFPFLVLFAVLVMSPARRFVESGAATVRRAPTPRAPSPRVRVSGGAAGLAVLVAVPFVVGTDVGLYTEALATVVLFTSLGLLVRTSGQVSLAHMAFAGIGAGVFANLASGGMPWGLALLVAGLAAVPAGAVIAIPAIRLSGLFLAIATFGFGILVERIFYGADWLFGVNGVASSVPAPRPVGFGSPRAYYFLVLGIVVLTLVFAAGVRRSRLGRLLRGLAESPRALSASGLDTRLTRLLVFAVSAFLAGIAGALIGPVTGAAAALSFGFFESLLLLAVLAIAGRRPVLSPFLAAIAYGVLPIYVDDETLLQLFPIAFGVVAVVAATRRIHDDTGGAATSDLERRARERVRRPRAAERGQPVVPVGGAP